MTTIGQGDLLGADTTSGSGGSAESWFEALARAWGAALDGEAQKISDMSNAIGSGGNQDPSQVALLTAESQRMAFMANSEASSVSSVGEALQTMARKQ